MPTDLTSPVPSSTEVNALADRLAADMRRRWEEGDRPLTEDYLAAYPALRDHPGAAAELIYEEVSRRRGRGEPDGSGEVLRRFPQWAAQLRVLLDLRDALDAEGEPDYPGVGDRLGEFDLLAELGRGRRGQVYLARQPALADRPVVVKLTPRVDAEHLSLARLQHTHIVPLYAAHDDPARRLRVLCMPFFGGATLAHTLARLGPTPPADRTPADLWAAVGTGPGNDTAAGEARPLPPPWAAADYARVIAHLGACLADALQFAHERHLVHMDVKPSNVLLTAEGQPMLLDFHLARPPVVAGDPPPAWLGGTPAYLSPEQGCALDAVRSAGRVSAGVDGRSDVYSLGVVLYEALAGALPDAVPTPLSSRNPGVSVGLSDVIARCLRTDPGDRYPGAAALADDLRRHLADLPLRGVRNRSLPERWRKWRRRRPHALGAAGVLALLVAVAGFAAGYVGHRRELARAALDEGNAELARGRFAEARGAFRRGLAVVGGLPVRGGLEADLGQGLRRADRATAAGDLHAVAEVMRALTVADGASPADLVKAVQLGSRLWERRADLFALAAADLPPAVRDQARVDLLDVALVWSDLRVRLAPPGRAAAERRAATEVLTEADRELGPCARLYLERAALARELGRPADAEADLRRSAATPRASAWEHVALGVHHLRSAAPGLARAEFERAVSRDPRSFWARLHLGRCDLALGRADDALLAFAVCVGLDPDNPVGHLHKGLAHARLGHRDKALADIDRALDLDPTDPQARALREAVARTH
jgi:serine/threonine protein kinase